ncbi:MAG: hypothetical protein IGS03_02095 [Candidatus Sericytochromatia bacterium]|nr:hypothetical protein [Candidatus Sericytochromatia bacterium]
MRIKFEQLGYLDHADIELGELTLICGTNNVGKTYLNYGVYGVLEGLPMAMHFTVSRFVQEALKVQDTFKLIEDRQFEIHLDSIKENFSKILKSASGMLRQGFSTVFSSSEELFASTKIDLPTENWLPIDFLYAHQDTQEYPGFLLTTEKQAGESSFLFGLLSKKTQFDMQEKRIIYNYIESQLTEYILNRIPSAPFPKRKSRLNLKT